MRVFFSYAHEDRKYLSRLKSHLSLLRREGLLRSWDDGDITAGKRWADEIDTNLDTADLILLLISSDFMASDYCYEKELPRALARQDERWGPLVIPIIVRQVDWQGAPFTQLQVLPRDAKPVTEWSPQDAGWTDVAKGVRRIIEERNSIPVEESAPSSMWSEPPCTGEAKETFDQLVALASEYNRARGMLPGQDRTHRMTRIISEARQLAPRLSPEWSSQTSGHLFLRGTDGDRIIAIGVIQFWAEASFTFWIIQDAIAHSRSGFEQYHALIAAEKMIQFSDCMIVIENVWEELGTNLVRTIKDQRSGGEGKYITPGSDRWIVSERILSALGDS